MNDQDLQRATFHLLPQTVDVEPLNDSVGKLNAHEVDRLKRFDVRLHHLNEMGDERKAGHNEFVVAFDGNFEVELIHRDLVALWVHALVALRAYAPDHALVGKPSDEALTKIFRCAKRA